MRFTSVLAAMLAVIVFAVFGTAAAQDIVVEQLQVEVDQTKNKVTGNEDKINNLGTNFQILQNQIDNIELTPGPPGADGIAPVITIGENGNWHINGEDTGVPATGPAGQDGGQSGHCYGDSPEVDSFFAAVPSGTQNVELSLLDPSEEFIVTDITVRVFNPVDHPVADRFTLQSGGAILFDASASPTGVVTPQEAFEETFHFESGLRIPPGSDILFDKVHNNLYIASVTISGYTCEAGTANVDSFYGNASPSEGSKNIAQLAPGQGFIITDVAARAYNPDTNTYDVLDRFNIQSQGEALLETAASGDGRLSPNDRGQTFFSFKSGLRVPPGGDISFLKIRHADWMMFFLGITVSGYYYEEGNVP